jgi:hypothetical protein
MWGWIYQVDFFLICLGILNSAVNSVIPCRIVWHLRIIRRIRIFVGFGLQYRLGTISQLRWCSFTVSSITQDERPNAAGKRSEHKMTHRISVLSLGTAWGVPGVIMIKNLYYYKTFILQLNLGLRGTEWVILGPLYTLISM